MSLSSGAVAASEAETRRAKSDKSVSYGGWMAAALIALDRHWLH
jgi:hypothetical protein